MRLIDARIDYCDQDIVTFGDLMRLRQMQLGQFILRRIALGFAFALLQREQIIRLRRGHHLVGLQLADHGRH